MFFSFYFCLQLPPLTRLSLPKAFPQDFADPPLARYLLMGDLKFISSHNRGAQNRIGAAGWVDVIAFELECQKKILEVVMMVSIWKKRRSTIKADGRAKKLYCPISVFSVLWPMFSNVARAKKDRLYDVQQNHLRAARHHQRASCCWYTFALIYNIKNWNWDAMHTHAVFFAATVRQKSWRSAESAPLLFKARV